MPLSGVLRYLCHGARSSHGPTGNPNSEPIAVAPPTARKRKPRGTPQVQLLGGFLTHIPDRSYRFVEVRDLA
jgi:hypothetical protein